MSEYLVAETEEVLDPKERFIEMFKTFRDRSGRLKYRDRIRRMSMLGLRSLIIDFDDVFLFDRQLAKALLDDPARIIEAASEAVKEIMLIENAEYAESVDKFYARFRRLPETTPLRKLRSEYIGKLVMIEGILVRCTAIKEQIVEATFKCLSCGMEFPVIQESEILETPVQCPNPECPKKNGPFKLIPERSKFIDWQKVVIQERPEEVPAGQLPRSIEVVLRGDIVDTARPGDRVNIVGILKVKEEKLPRRGSKATYDLIIDANYIEVSQKALEEVEISKEDEAKILELSRDPWIRKKIIKSIAPSIYGHWDIKEAIALLLFGGVPKMLEDGTRIRGDIHVLIIGDPGTAKSQLLQFAARIAPRGIYTSGKGATAAGLTAAVIRDKATGEYYLEAGALVLADGGVACIDEIDKMRSEDRVAIHEAMEQQTVSIAKAGIVARLNARASVLAAGNPAFGRYLPNRSLSENVNLPVTILSRFDLIFVLRDVPSEEQDRSMAEHILRVHKEAELVKPEIPPDLLKKYISYARRYVRPKLTEEALAKLRDFFVEMRRKSAESPDSPVAITARQLEALVRLAEAHARMALKDRVEEEDAEEAIRLMKTFLESVGIDVETGRIDIDVVMTGKPRSQQEKLSVLMKIIEELEEEAGMAKVKDVVKRAEEKGLDRAFIEKALRMLKREGAIYEPRPGYIARVQ